MSRKILIDAAFAEDVADCLESEGYDFSARSIRAALNEPEPADVAALRKDAERYRWLRDRMQVYYQSPVFGGEKRATLTMRVGHGFLDSKRPPETGWTDQKYFDECREKVTAAIDAAMVKS